MILRKIFAENASNYDKLDYEFKLGITLINGDNLSGKSSILDIIQFAIYGNCVKSKKIEYFKKRGSKGPLITKIWFEYKGKEWYIYRQYSGREKVAEIMVDEQVKANGIENVNTYISDNFVSESFLTNSNLCQQKDTSGLLSVPRDTDRFNTCKKIFNLEEYKKKADLVKTDTDDNITELDKTKGELQRLESEIKAIEEWINQTDPLSILEDRLKEEGAKKESLEKEKEAFLAKKTSLEKDLENIEKENEDINKSNGRIIEMDDNIADKIEKLKKYQESLTEQTNLVKSAKVGSGIKDKEIQELQDKSDKIIPPRVPTFDDKSITDMVTVITKAEGEVQKIVDQITFAAQGICPTCKQPIKNVDMDKLNKDRENLEAIVYKKQKSLGELEKKRDTVREKEKEAQTIREEKLTLEGEIQTKIKEKEQMETAIPNYQKQVNENEELVNTTIDDLQKMKKEREGMKIQELVSNTEIVEALEELKQKILNYIGLIDVQNTTVDNIKEGIITFKAKVKAKRDAETSFKDTEKKITEINKEIDVLKEVRNIFEKKLPLFMVLNKLQYISEKSNEFLHKTFDKYDISFEANKDALSIIMTDNVTSMPSDYTNLSGFEESLGGLSIRVGFGLYNSTFNKDPIYFIALDEVDKSFRNERAELLYKALIELRSMFKQIIMVTHKPQIKEIIRPENVIEVKNNGLNSYIEMGA